MECPGCGYFLPGGQSGPQIQGQPIPQDGCPNCGRPYEGQQSSIQSEMSTRNVPGAGGSASPYDDSGGNPLGEGILAKVAFADQCPYCGGSDLEPFQDGTGKYCHGCMSNIHNEDTPLGMDTMNSWNTDGGNRNQQVPDTENWQNSARRDDSYASLYSFLRAPKEASKPKVFDIEASWNDNLKESADFDVTQVVLPGPSTVEVEQEGEMNPLILQHDNPEVLDEAKSTLKSSGILDTILGGGGAMEGASTGAELGSALGPVGTVGGGLIGGLLGRALGEGAGNAIGGGGGGGQQAYPPANNLQTLASEEPEIDLNSELGQAFKQVLPLLAQFAHSPESGANHPDIAKFTIMFDQNFPGLKDQPIKPEHQAEIDSIKPQKTANSIWEIIHQAANDIPPPESSYGVAPGQKGPDLSASPEEDDIMDDMVRLLSGYPNFAPEDAASIISQRVGMTPEQVMNIYDKANVNDWQHVIPEARNQAYRQIYEPSNYPPQWGDYDEAPQGAHPLSSIKRSDGWGSGQYDDPNTRSQIVDTEDPHGDGIDAAVHGDNPDAWQRQDDQQGGGSDSSLPPALADAFLEFINTHYPDLLKQSSMPVNMNPPITPSGDNAMTIPCPNCGNPAVSGLICPQCHMPVGGGQPAQNLNQGMSPLAETPSTMQSLGGVGPHNMPQIQMVKQYLEQNGQWSPEVADMLITNPDDPMFTEALAAIQQKGTVPDVDPNQPPPPMGPPPDGAPPPGGGAPPGAGGPPGQTQMMQASRTAADNLAPRCPNCSSGTTSLDTEDGLCHCHACNHKWKLPDEQADTIHSSAMENTWITQDGQNLAPGMKVLMFSFATPIPDEVTITDVKPNSIVYKLEGSFGLDHETEITRQEAQIDGLTFAIDPSQQGDQGMMEHEPPAIEPNTNDDNTGFVGPGEGTTNLAVQSSEHRFCANCESPHQTGIHEAHAHLCRSCAFDLDYGNGLNKTAGADFSRSEQLSFINEPGVARNLSDLKLEGTHYQEIDTEDLLFW